MAQYFTNIVGNDALRQRLAADILSDSFSHAYIIEGREGSGRHTLARNLAAALCCLDRHSDTFPCLQCEACRKVLEDKTPDVILVGLEEDRATIGVEASRFIRQDAMVVPNDFERKIYIIEDADLMTEQAQNALLLTLEEPHSYAVFFLLCDSASSLLETVRSRAPIIRTEPLSNKQLSDYLIDNDSRAAAMASGDSEQFSALLQKSNGCIGRALTLLDPKKSKAEADRHTLAETFVRIFASKASAVERAGLVKGFPAKRNEATETLCAVSLAIRDLIALKKSDTAPLCFYSDREAATELSYRFAVLPVQALPKRRGRHKLPVSQLKHSSDTYRAHTMSFIYDRKE